MSYWKVWVRERTAGTHRIVYHRAPLTREDSLELFNRLTAKLSLTCQYFQPDRTESPQRHEHWFQLSRGQFSQTSVSVYQVSRNTFRWFEPVPQIGGMTADRRQLSIFDLSGVIP